MSWTNPYHTRSGDPVSAAGAVIRFPAYVLWTLWGFGVSWFETRDFRRVWQGFPAVLLAGLLVVLLLRQGRPASSNVVDSYREKAQQATRLEEFDRADFYFRKLEQLAPGDSRIRYDHALLHAARDDYPQAVHIMLGLIQDEDQSDDEKAHLWLARSAIEGRLDMDEPLAFAKIHLNQLLEENPNHRYAHFFYSQLFLRMNDLDNAIRHLEPVASQSPDLQMQLAALYGLQGDRTRSRSLAQEAADLLEQGIRDTQTADVSKWLQLAGCYLLLEDYESAVTILKQAITKFDDEACRKTLGRTYVRWSDDVSAKSPENIGRRMELLQEALRVAPDDPLALQRIVEIAGTEGPAAAEAKARLRESLADGKAPAVIHFALGTMEAAAGNMEAALRHLDQARAINPHTAVTLNNLAYVLLHRETPDLERALDVSNQALRMVPAAAPFRETRGQILTSLGRYAEAVSDLEFALPKIPRVPTQISIHQSLAACYRELGDAELARIHEQKAEQLQSKLSDTDTGTPSLDPFKSDR